MTTPRPGLLRRRVLGVLVAVFSLAAFERGARWVRAEVALPTGTARWVWAPGEWWDRPEPIALAIACDFHLDSEPASAVMDAEADEDYELWLNGKFVGFGGFSPGDPLDSFEVAPLLQSGGNRLVARVRSGRGAGGFLASLKTGRHQLWGSGEGCRAIWNPQTGLVQGWLPLSEVGEPVDVLGLPPLGRWHTPMESAVHPAGWQLAANVPPIPSTRSVLAAPPSSDGWDQVFLFDFGKTVEGVLRLDVDGQHPGAALLFLGDELPKPGSHRGDRLAVLGTGEEAWTDNAPRRFRYALVAGLAGVRGAVVLPASAELRLASTTMPEGGVFGVRPPPQRSPMEDEIRRRLNGFSGTDLLPLTQR